MAGHEGLPALQDRGNIDEHRTGEIEIGEGGDGIKPEGIDDVSGGGFQGRQAAVAGQPAGIAGGLADGRMVGVLIGRGNGREDEGGFLFTDEAGDLGGVGRRGRLLSIAAKIENLEAFGSAEEFGRSLGFGLALSGAAVTGGFALRGEDEENFRSGVEFVEEDSSHAEFQVVGVGTQGEDARCGGISFHGR